MLRNLLLILVAVCTFAGASSSVGHANDSADGSSSDEWSFGFAPYLWLAGLKGDLATLPPLPPVSVDAKVSDLLENLDVGFMAVAELRKDRYGLLVDLVYTDIETKKATPRGLLFSNAKLKAKTFYGTFEGTYRVISEPKALLDLMAGARVTHADTELSLGAGLLSGRQLDVSETWVDPILGLKGRYDFCEGFYLTGWANVGGFGVSSEITWDIFGGIGYEVAEDIALLAGYRHFVMDYESGGFVFDVEQSGPVLGAVFRF